jgi:hypothetical protein
VEVLNKIDKGLSKNPMAKNHFSFQVVLEQVDELLRVEVLVPRIS